jgi:Fe-S-cluster containining protein
MAVNKDLPKTWIQYKSSLCSSCQATCCTMPVEITAEDLVRLEKVESDEISQNPKKVANRLIREGMISQYREKTGLFTVTQKSNSDCYFLDSNRMCTVYEKRPGVCRKFPTEMSRKINYCPYIQK